MSHPRTKKLEFHRVSTGTPSGDTVPDMFRAWAAGGWLVTTGRGHGTTFVPDPKCEWLPLWPPIERPGTVHWVDESGAEVIVRVTVEGGNAVLVTVLSDTLCEGDEVILLGDKLVEPEEGAVTPDLPPPLSAPPPASAVLDDLAAETEALGGYDELPALPPVTDAVPTQEILANEVGTAIDLLGKVIDANGVPASVRAALATPEEERAGWQKGLITRWKNGNVG